MSARRGGNNLVSVYESEITAIADPVTLTGLDMSRTHVFAGIQFFADELGTTPAVPTNGSVIIEASDFNTQRFYKKGVIDAETPDSIQWNANALSVRATPAGVTVATHYKLVVTCNEVTGETETDGSPLRVVGPEATYDAFGRSRISTIDTLFDSKLTNDALPLFWDDQEISGTGTSSVHSSDRASVTLGVADVTAGHRRRQTFQRFNYQPGKSQLILMTGVPIASGGGAGISVRAGLFDTENGIGAQNVDGSTSFFIRSNVTGTPVDTTIAQLDWNVDTLDGNGPSGITIDMTKAQILYFDFEWLGVGSVRFGFVIDGAYVLCHKQNHANTINSVYMSTPNLPLAYELVNDGTGPAATTEVICSSVMSEGGQEERAQLHAATTNGIGITPADGAVAAAIGIRLKSTHLDTQVDLSDLSFINEGNTPGFEWRLYHNPTVAVGTAAFTYAAISNAAVEVAIGAADGSNTLTGGSIIAAGVGTGAKRSALIEAAINNALRMGSSIAGVSDELVLAVIPYGDQAEIDAALNWRERT